MGRQDAYKRDVQSKSSKKNADEWEKQILRINALEVQMKSLLEFEKKIRTSMYRNSSEEKKRARESKDSK